jgi:branched-subunit amino acid transport protein
MTAVLALAGGALVTWLLRVGFVTLMPADRLPERARRTLRHLGPAVLSTLLVTGLADGHATAIWSPSTRHVALLAAAVVAWRFRNVALPLAAAVAVSLLLA